MVLQERVKRREHHADPFIITGDFNAQPSEGTIGLMLGRAYIPENDISSANRQVSKETVSSAIEPLIFCKDVWAFLHPEQVYARTFHGGKGEHGRGWRLDYIFVPLTVSLISADVLRCSDGGYFPSDHYPITASLLLQ